MALDKMSWSQMCALDRNKNRGTDLENFNNHQLFNKIDFLLLQFNQILSLQNLNDLIKARALEK